MRRALGLARIPVVELLERRVHCSSTPAHSGAVSDFQNPGVVPLIDGVVSAKLGSFRASLPLDRYSAELLWYHGYPEPEESDGGLVAQSDGTVAVLGSKSFDNPRDYVTVEIRIFADGKGVFDDYVSVRPPMAEQLRYELHPVAGDDSPMHLGNFYGYPGLDAASYTTSIDWGDGVHSAGYLRPAGTADEYELWGNHVYARAGYYPVTYSASAPPEVFDQAMNSYTDLQAWADASGGNPFESTSTIWSTGAWGDTLLASRDETISGIIAHFTGEFPEGQRRTISIDWGEYDGYPSTYFLDDDSSQEGVLVTPDGQGGFFVHASHKYYAFANDGEIFNGYVDIGGWDGPAVASAAFTVIPFAQDIAFGYGEGYFLDINEQPAEYEAARFYDFNPSEPAGYTAMIDWGDGTPMTAGTVTRFDEHQFRVYAPHRYTAQEDWYVYVLVTKADGTVANGYLTSIFVTGELTEEPAPSDEGETDEPPADPPVDPPVDTPTEPTPPPVDAVETPEVASPPLVQPEGSDGSTVAASQSLARDLFDADTISELDRETRENLDLLD